MHKTASAVNGLTDRPPGIIAVNRAEVRSRTRELARIAGRTPLQVSQADYEQAKRELLGGSGVTMRNVPPGLSTKAGFASTVLLKTDTH